MANNEEEHYREVSKLCFECFKHFTTVSTAAALIELALYQQFSVSGVSIVFPLVMLGASLLLSLIGMLYVPLRAGGDLQFWVRGRGLRGVAFLVLYAAALLLGGITSFVYAFLSVGTLGTVISIVIAIALVILFLILALRLAGPIQ